MKHLMMIGTDLNPQGFIDRGSGRMIAVKGPAHALAVLTQAGFGVEARGYRGDRGGWAIGGYTKDNLTAVKDATRFLINFPLLDADLNCKVSPLELLRRMPFAGIGWGTKSDKPGTEDRHCRIGVMTNDVFQSQLEFNFFRSIINEMLGGVISLESSKNLNKQSDLPLIRSELAYQEGTLFDLKGLRKKYFGKHHQQQQEQPAGEQQQQGELFALDGTLAIADPSPVLVVGSPQHVDDHLVAIVAKQVERIRSAPHGCRNDTCASAAAIVGSAWAGATANGGTLSEDEVRALLVLTITSRDWSDYDIAERVEVIERQFAWGSQNRPFADMGVVEQDAFLTRMKVFRKTGKRSRELLLQQYNDNRARARYTRTSQETRGDPMKMLRFDEAYKAKTGKDLTFVGTPDGDVAAFDEDTLASEALPPIVVVVEVPEDGLATSPTTTTIQPPPPSAPQRPVRTVIPPPRNAASARIREVYKLWDVYGLEKKRKKKNG